MTRIFVFYHIIQNSLELKNELQWKKYHVYGGIHCILILTKNRGYLGFWKVSCHGVFFREGVWFFLHFLMNFYCTPLEKSLVKYYDAKKKWSTSALFEMQLL